MNCYYTLESKSEFMGEYGNISDGEIVEKKSKFYSYVFKINSEEQALEYIETIKKKNVGARHVVYIYSLLNKNNITNIRFNDDGEPQGTGTKAIYELLEKEKITNICIVIVRYFGGILLGAGPLARTYLNTARTAIEKCNKKEIYRYIELKFNTSYNGYNILKNKIEEYIKKEYIKIKECTFKESVELTIEVVDFEQEYIEKIIEEINYGT